MDLSSGELRDKLQICSAVSDWHSGHSAYLLSDCSKPEKLVRLAGAVAAAVFLMGNIYTTYYEIKKAPNRLEIYEKRVELALDFENLSDDELRDKFEYRKNREDSGAKVRSALTILKENGYSIFHYRKSLKN